MPKIKIRRPEGFTKEEYLHLTGGAFLNWDTYDTTLKVGADGKVYEHDATGNVSQLGGSDSYAKKGVLLTCIWAENEPT